MLNIAPFTFEIRCVGVETHQFDSLVVASGRHQLSIRRPRETIYRALVVLRSLEENRGLIRLMVLPVETRIRQYVVKRYFTVLCPCFSFNDRNTLVPFHRASITKTAKRKHATACGGSSYQRVEVTFVYF